MSDPLLKLSEIKFLRNDGIKYYKWMRFLRNGRFLLESTINKQPVVGKVLRSSSEGEQNIWPQLQHDNINRLLEVLHINDHFKILISPFVGQSIGTLIYDESFNKHPLCFDRKRSYFKGIFSALSYMHQNSVFHLNLSDENIRVCSYTDEAMLCDFSYTVALEKVTKSFLPPNRSYLPPEVQNGSDNEEFGSWRIDVWDCGILLLQVFTQHQLPWRGAVSDSLELLDIEILKKANPGANLHKKVASEFKTFVQHLVSWNPEFRPSATDALQSCFLQDAYNRFNRKARRLWKNNEIIKENDYFTDCDQTDSRDSKSDKAHLNWTKSEPSAQISPDVTPLPRYVSFPSISRNNDANNVNSTKEIHHSSHLSEWEEDNPPYIKDDLSYCPYPESPVSKEEEFPKCPSCGLEQMLPEIVSMSGLNLDFALPDWYNNSPSSILKESHLGSESNICKAEKNEWIDIPLKNSQKLLPLQSDMNSNCEVTKKETVSRKEDLVLPSWMSPSKALKKSDSPIFIDKRNLYKISETDMAGHNKFYTKKTRAPKWYHKLCCGCCNKRAN